MVRGISIHLIWKINDHKVHLFSVVCCLGEFLNKCQQLCLAATSGSETVLTISQDLSLFQVSHGMTGDNMLLKFTAEASKCYELQGINHNGVRSTIHKLVFPVVVNFLRKGTFYTVW